MEALNPETNVNFYSKISGFDKCAEVITTPPGMTNHNGHPLNYPHLIEKTSNSCLLVANTNHFM